MTSDQIKANLRNSFPNDLSAKFTEQYYGVLDAETQYVKTVEKNYGGYVLYSKCFFIFMLETIDIATEKSDRDINSLYPVFVFDMLTSFKCLRSAEILFLNGYPYNAIPILRDQKDQALFKLAIAKELTTFKEYREIGAKIKQDLTSSEVRKLSEKRRKYEEKLKKALVHNLNYKDKELLKKWEKLFHAEVHGSKLTKSDTASSWKETGHLRLSPQPSKKSLAFYMNRSMEIQWLILNNLFLLQPTQNAFDENWMRKWSILNDTYKSCFKDLAKQGKEHFTTFINFVEHQNHDKAQVYYKN